jgi:hypothetical protein
MDEQTGDQSDEAQKKYLLTKKSDLTSEENLLFRLMSTRRKMDRVAIKVESVSVPVDYNERDIYLSVIEKEFKRISRAFEIEFGYVAKRLEISEQRQRDISFLVDSMGD